MKPVPTTKSTRPVAEEAPAGAVDGHFHTDHLMADLNGRSVRGGMVTVSAQGAKFFLQLGSTAVLARLLTPMDFGLIAMVAAFTGFVSLFKDLGLSMATVQRERISHEQVSTLFWINVALSLVLMMIAAAMSPVVAWFYGEPRLTLITVAISATFILGGLTAQHTALLRRQMRFVPLVAMEILAMAAGIGAAIALAAWGAGYWSLVAMTATTATTTMVLAWLFSGWRPGLPKRTADVWPMISFGGNLTGSNVLSYVSRNADNVLLGWAYGAGVLGLYSRAYSLMLLPINQFNAPVSTVAVSALSRLADDPSRYRRAFTQFLASITIATLPVVTFLLLEASSVIRLLLGDQWLGAVPIFQWLGIAALCQVVTQTNGWLFISQGRTGDMLRWGCVGSTLTVISFIAGLPWGAVGVAAAYAISSVLIRTPIVLWWVCRRGPVRVRDYLGACSGGLSVAALAAAFVLSVRPILQPTTAIDSTFLSIALFTIAFVFSCLFLPPVRAQYKLVRSGLAHLRIQQ